MIAGLVKVTAGQVLIGGMVVNDLPPRARKIAMFFQSYALYPHMTVFKNISFPLRAQGFPKEKVKEKVLLAASIFGIEILLDGNSR
jgi:multiple sugar transport system ATP-binding protein